MSTENLTAAGKAALANPIELRRWAIELAIECDRQESANVIVAMAAAFVDFVNGTNDAEIVRAARELADKVKG